MAGRKPRGDYGMAEKQPDADLGAIMASAEVQAAIREAAIRAAEEAMADFGDQDRFLQRFGAMIEKFAGAQALATAEIADQGTSRKRVAPEILARREAAAKRCRELVAEARRKSSDAHVAGDQAEKERWMPTYRVTSKVYFGERLIEPWRRLPGQGAGVVAQEIVWMGVPNDALSPINETAQEIYAAYRESVGSTEQLRSVKGPHGGIAEQDNRLFWMTPGGLVVKGDPPPKMFVGTSPEMNVRPQDNNDPNAPEVFVLGTVAAPARQNTAHWPQPRASA